MEDFFPGGVPLLVILDQTHGSAGLAGHLVWCQLIIWSYKAVLLPVYPMMWSEAMNFMCSTCASKYCMRNSGGMGVSICSSLQGLISVDSSPAKK